MRRFRPESHSLRPSSTSTDTWPKPPPTDINCLLKPPVDDDAQTNPTTSSSSSQLHNLELQLLTTNSTPLIHKSACGGLNTDEDHSSTQLQLSIGSSHTGVVVDRNEPLLHENLSRNISRCSLRESSNSDKPSFIASRLKEQAREILRLAMAERTYAEEARQQAKRQIVLAEQEFVNAKRIRQQAQAELDKAHAIREHAIEQISSTILQITCYACKHKFQAAASTTTSTPSQDDQ